MGPEHTSQRTSTATPTPRAGVRPAGTDRAEVVGPES